METLEEIRVYSGDPLRVAQDEAVGDGTRLLFSLNNDVVAENEKVYIDGVLQTAGYEIEQATGTVTFATAPADGAIVLVLYKWSLLSDEFIEARYAESSSVLAAAISCLLAMASSYALLAKSVTIGGYVKSETQIAKELREQAKALMEQMLEQDPGGAEAFTNVQWTTFGDRNL